MDNTKTLARTSANISGPTNILGKKAVFNLYGTWTLYSKEVLRFIKVFNQTLVAPLITALLFLAIFSLALGDRVKQIEGIDFEQFIACGLVIMAIVQQSFANTSSSIILAKVWGTFNDLLIVPLSAGEINFALAMAAITRGVVVGVIVGAAVFYIVGIEIEYPLLMIVYAVICASMLAVMGIIAGLYSESFEQVAIFTNYFVTPMAFLSGTFYSVKALPEFWYQVSHYNPFFYMIDGFRYSAIGYTDSSIPLGVGVLLGFNAILWFIAYKMLKSGYKVKG